MNLQAVNSGAAAGAAWAHKPVGAPRFVRRAWNALPQPELRRVALGLFRFGPGRPVGTALAVPTARRAALQVTPALLHRAVVGALGTVAAAAVYAYGLVFACPADSVARDPMSPPCDRQWDLRRARAGADKVVAVAGTNVEIYLVTVAACALLGATFGALCSALPARRDTRVVAP